MSPQKGAYPADLLNADGTLKEPAMPDVEEAKNEQALGHLLMSAIRTTFKGPQGLLITVLLAWVGMSPLTAAYSGFFGHASPSTSATDLLRIVKKIQKDTVEIKITNKAILSTLPDRARQLAETSIRLQLAAIEMASNKEAQ